MVSAQQLYKRKTVYERRIKGTVADKIFRFSSSGRLMYERQCVNKESL